MDDFDFDDDEELDQCDSIEMVMNDNGELTLKPETIEMTLTDFDKLNKGLILLKEKYPDISKECFP